jgi:cell division protein FtsB
VSESEWRTMGDIVKARQDLAYARALAANQRRIIERLKWERADIKGAERTLERYEQSQRTLEDEVKKLEAG